MLSKAIAFQNVKKNALRLSDRVAALFLMRIVEKASELGKGKTLEPDDIVKALKDLGYDEYVGAFKQDAEEDEGEDSGKKKKKREKEGSERSKSKKKD